MAAERSSSNRSSTVTGFRRWKIRWTPPICRFFIKKPPVEYIQPYKNPPDALHPYTKFRMDAVQAQDHMAWETQGPIADRTRERLTSSDRGIVMLREVMMREIDRVQQGHDPMGVVRD